jgi:rhodanese-related sulfurtransferase
MIIQGDPTLELVDVRPAKDYEIFTLPRALNIPLDSILVKDYQSYLGITNMKVVFFSDDDIKADQTWVIAKRMGFKSLYVMKGGLNQWIRTIIKPEIPPETAPETAFEQYNFRKAASIYFTGSKITAPEEGSKSKIIIKRKKKSSAVEGGC